MSRTPSNTPSPEGPASLAFGQHQLAIPGPSVVPERVLRAMHKSSPNIYEGALVELVDSLYPDLNRVARNSGHVVIYHGNGHAAWEASLNNTHSRGDQSLVMITGRFGRGWMDMATFNGIDAQYLDFGPSLPVDPQQLKDRLLQDTSHSIRSVLTVQTDTASSVSNDIPAIRQAIDEAGHPALLMVDCIASLGCEPFHMDDWGVDVMVAGSQKGLMTPAGLAFTFLNNKALEVSTTADLRTAYWDWQRRVTGQYFHQKFCGTPPTHHLFGLREALDMLAEEGLENTWNRHRTLANAVWAAVDAWSNSNNHMGFNVQSPGDRSLAVTAIRTLAGDSDRVRRWCEDNAGLTLGVGLDLTTTVGGQTDSLFRIGHMGHLSPPMILGTLACVDAALKSLGIAQGEGASAAAAYIGSQL